LTRTQTYHQNQLNPFSFKYKAKQKSCVRDMYANQLTAVADGGDITKGFKDKVNTADYTYDTAGNMVTDANKDLSIAYNHLNLPASITRTNSGTNNGVIKHYYAGATKVRMETYDAAGTTLVKAYDYLAGMVYQETVVASVSTKTLDFIASPEGRAIPKAKVNPADVATTGDQMKFEYSLKDHLGNLRVSCRCGELKRDAQGVIIPTGQPGAGIDAIAVVQEQHYDAWGLAFNAGTVSSSEVENRKDKFTYNGKELVSDLDLGWNDYGARMYMSEIGRWNGVDLMCELTKKLTPYNYALNNPVKYTDPDGMMSTSSTTSGYDFDFLKSVYEFEEKIQKSYSEKLFEPNKKQALTWDQAKKIIESNKISSLQGLRYTDGDANGKQVGPFGGETGGRYIFTKKYGWVDLGHFFQVAAGLEENTNEYTKAALQIPEFYYAAKFRLWLKTVDVENDQQEPSIWSYEDAPSNHAGFVYFIWFHNSKDIIKSLDSFFEYAEGTSPEEATNWEEMQKTPQKTRMFEQNRSFDPIFSPKKNEPK
jgi:RHS repeat-associated protein